MSDLNISPQGATVAGYFASPPAKTVDPAEKDIRSGDFDSAKTALSTLQQNMTAALTNAANPANTDTTNLLSRHVQAMAGAMASGDVTAAQKLTHEKKLEDPETVPDNEESEDSPQEVIYSANHGNVIIPKPTGTQVFFRA